MTEVSVWLAQVQPSNPYQSIVKLYIFSHCQIYCQLIELFIELLIEIKLR